ncbi:MAG: ATP phosphoribosyltransferase regulatory subunit [Alphaproteobacteria bacterium]|nr:ATP phosphoribosyltransferase regulatory subunit [Alphaproteobacteria bacterium]
MQKISLYKGMREFTPKTYAPMQRIYKVWENVCTQYGYEPYRTPLLEHTELYTKKTSEEIVGEQMYSFTDKKGRSISLRPEVTPSIARMVSDLAFHRDLPSPFKIWSIGSVFRYEQTQHGRTREHVQLNVDIFNYSSATAELELLDMLSTIFLNLGIKKNGFTIRYNDRTHINNALIAAGVSKEETKSVTRLLDKKEKMPIQELRSELKKITTVSFEDIQKNLRTPPEQWQFLHKYFKNTLVYDPFLMRGFDYYTGFIFEAFSTDKENTRSLCGGGRYDALVEMYGETKVSAVGFGMGDVVLNDVVTKIKTKKEARQTAIAVIAEESADEMRAYNTAKTLRKKYQTNVLYLGHHKKEMLYKKLNASGTEYAVYVHKTNASLKTIATKKMSAPILIKKMIAKVISLLEKKKK